MTDRELLELAAKAAGIEVVTPTMLQYGKWNPLTDYGDTLQLAASLKIDIMFRSVGGLRVECLAPGGSVMIEHYKPGEEMHAVCRAIVRSAVAVGEGI